MAALFFDRISNAKFSVFKTEISNQELQGRDVVPSTYDQVLKLKDGYKKNQLSPTTKKEMLG